MVTKGKKKGTLRFAIKPADDGAKVQLAGEFNDWTPQPMRKNKKGEYVAVLPLGEGTYEYKYVVDGEWRTDPDTSSWAVNPYGTMNSVVTAE